MAGATRRDRAAARHRLRRAAWLIAEPDEPHGTRRTTAACRRDSGMHLLLRTQPARRGRAPPRACRK
ncbi:protein of unknown function [Paraburkholderia kururiensis]